MEQKCTAFGSLARSSSHFLRRVMVYFITTLFSFEPSKPSSQSLASPLRLPQKLQRNSMLGAVFTVVTIFNIVRRGRRVSDAARFPFWGSHHKSALTARPRRHCDR